MFTQQIHGSDFFDIFFSNFSQCRARRGRLTCTNRCEQNWGGKKYKYEERTLQHFNCLSLSLSLFHLHTLSLPVSLSPCLPLSLFLSFTYTHTLSPCLSLSLFLFLLVSLSLSSSSLTLFLSLFFPPSLYFTLKRKKKF
jgi:hypothetical protein